MKALRILEWGAVIFAYLLLAYIAADVWRGRVEIETLERGTYEVEGVKNIGLD